MRLPTFSLPSWQKDKARKLLAIAVRQSLQENPFAYALLSHISNGKT